MEGRMTPPRGLAKLLRFPSLAVAAVWGFYAVSKIGWPASDGSWLSEFPQALVWTVIVAEAVAAFLIFVGRPHAGLSVGFTLLLAFSVTLMISPPDPGQDCGCAGSVLPSSLPGAIASHLFAFAAAHLLAVAVLGESKQNSVASRRFIRSSARSTH